tara:strand:+ start:483 stop:671 length:189 start_codon:yes stop_codon:yes gene_type:complete
MTLGNCNEFCLQKKIEISIILKLKNSLKQLQLLMSLMLYFVVVVKMSNSKNVQIMDMGIKTI